MGSREIFRKYFLPALRTFPTSSGATVLEPYPSIHYGSYKTVVPRDLQLAIPNHVDGFKNLLESLLESLDSGIRNRGF